MSLIDSATVCKFLQVNFDKRAASVSFIGSGMFSQAFSFTVDRQAFVFRLNAYEEDFQKDAFAYHHFSAPALPIPKVVRIGWFDDPRYFAITERCEGWTFNEMDDGDVCNVVPRLFETLDAIHSIDVSGYKGWGLTDATGNGLFESWEDYLLSLYNQKFAFDWSDLTQHTFLEWDVYETFLEAIEQLLPYFWF
jgi:hygromycin-B 4-O-kinase